MFFSFYILHSTFYSYHMCFQTNSLEGYQTKKQRVLKLSYKPLIVLIVVGKEPHCPNTISHEINTMLVTKSLQLTLTLILDPTFKTHQESSPSCSSSSSPSSCSSIWNLRGLDERIRSEFIGEDQFGYWGVSRDMEVELD